MLISLHKIKHLVWGARLGTGSSVSESVPDSQWSRFLNLTGVDGIISSENSDGDCRIVSSVNCFLKWIKLNLKICSIYNFNEMNWTCIMIGWK